MTLFIFEQKLNVNSEMEGTTVTSIVTAILTFLGGTGFAKLIDYFKNRTNKKYLEKLTTNLQDLSKIYRIMEQILESSTAYRVLILKASNGGGIPKPGSEMFIKLLYATAEIEDLSLYDKYNSVKVDGQYVDMLIEMQKDGYVVKKTDEMNNCLFKRINLAEQIKYSELYFLGNNEQELYFCIINTNKKIEDFSEPTKRISVELGINDLRKVFVKHMI